LIASTSSGSFLKPPLPLPANFFSAESPALLCCVAGCCDAGTSAPTLVSAGGSSVVGGTSPPVTGDVVAPVLVSLVCLSLCLLTASAALAICPLITLRLASLRIGLPELSTAS